MQRGGLAPGTVPMPVATSTHRLLPEGLPLTPKSAQGRSGRAGSVCECLSGGHGRMVRRPLWGRGALPAHPTSAPGARPVLTVSAEGLGLAPLASSSAALAFVRRRERSV